MKPHTSTLSRREFAAVSFGAAAGSKAFGQASVLTAGQVVERIQKNLGTPWRGGNTDTFKTGGPETPVTGIVTTMMSTFDVLKRSVAAGKNMIITHEPTFWTGNDEVSGFVSDPLYVKKRPTSKNTTLSSGDSTTTFTRASPTCQRSAWRRRSDGTGMFPSRTRNSMTYRL